MITLNNRKLCENCFSETTVEPCPHCGFTKSAYRHDPVTLAVGSVLNQRYMIGGVIGKGGFGITYLAYDLKLDARLAVKEYYPMGLAIRNPGSTLVSVSNEESEQSFRTGAEKFYSEAKMVARFNGNPNIVSVHDFFYENDTVYFTMGYLQGETLKSYLKRKKITEGQAVCVFNAIANALMASHSLSILHRDISPDNIMLCDDGTIRLLDFGAARQVMAEQSQSLSVILKQGFAPLEQYQKKGKQGPWTDIYALGATVYTALTGDMLNDPMTRLEDDSEFTANKYGISDPLWNIIQKCTQLKIQDRYQDIPELKRDLNSAGIESEGFSDIEEEITDLLRGRNSKGAGNTSGSGNMPNYAPASDPNATMLLGGNESQNRTMSMDPNATVYLGASEGGSSNETVAMSPEEAAAYTAGLQSPAQGGAAGVPQQPAAGGFTGARQPVTGGFTGAQQPAAGGFTGAQQPVTGGFTGPQQPITGGFTGPQQPFTGGYTGPQQPVTGGFTGVQQPAAGGYTGPQQPGQRQKTAPAPRKGVPLPVIIIACLLAMFIISTIIVAVVLRVLTKEDPGDEGSTEPTGETVSADTGSDGSTEVLESLGLEGIETYIDDTYKYSISYPSGYEVFDADDNAVEIVNDEGTLHVAVRYMDRYIDGSILYDAKDFSNMINVRPDNLLPVSGSGSTPEVKTADKGDIGGQKDISHFGYEYEDNDGNVWVGNVYVFDSLGQYGCYVLYTLENDKADDYDGLMDIAVGCADSFRIDAAYDPEEIDIYTFDDLGVKLSVRDGIEAYTSDDDELEAIHVRFVNGDNNRNAYVIPADSYGTEYADMLTGATSALNDVSMEIVSDMIPLDFGEYKGYWVDMICNPDSDNEEGKIYAFQTNLGSDAKYQSYVVIGSAADDDQLRDIVGGFRFEGATTYDNAGVDTSETVSISEGTSGGDNVDDFLDDYSTEISKSDYIFPETDSREMSNSDVKSFLSGYLESNNAKDMSESEKRVLCARALCYARNEIYARHGYIFNSSELRDLFNSMDWYDGEIPSDRFDSNVFSPVEKHNIEFLKAKMEEYGGYQPAK